MEKKKTISIIDKEYVQWVKSLVERYRQSQIKAAVRVNAVKLKFNWQLGHEIVELKVEERWGEGVIEQLSKDLKKEMPHVEGFSVTNLGYCKRFYLLYSHYTGIYPQLGGKLDKETSIIHPQPGGEMQQNDSQELNYLFEIPWGHHKLIIDKVKGNVNKALYFVQQTIENGWSRSILLNWIDTGLYERSGKAITNFKKTIPDTSSGLAQELTKDPYNFAFAGITKKHNETQLKEALLENITNFLIELGTGFAYVGKEYRLQIGDTEKFIDLLFYNIRLRCYVVVEVKIDKFDSQDIGQLGTYVTAANHLLKEEGKDNPTIGLLICRSKDNTLAKYALESTSQPIGISEYELERFYPAKIEGTIPTIEEIESKLNNNPV